MCGERADEVGEVIERRYIGHNSSHNTPIATPTTPSNRYSVMLSDVTMAFVPSL